MATLTQIVAAEVESLLYDQIHKLLGKIAEDYELNHGEMVEKYLISQRGKSPPPQYIFKATGDEEEVKPKKAKKAKVKVTKAKSESDEDDRTGKCTAQTAKGTLCKNKAFGGGCTCRVHTPKEGEEKKEPKEKKAPAKRGRKPKKVEPEHSHKLDEPAVSDCELCETHGNPLEGEQEFEVPAETTDRMANFRKLMEEVDSDTEEEILEDIEKMMEEEMAAESEGEEVVKPKKAGGRKRVVISDEEDFD